MRAKKREQAAGLADVDEILARIRRLVNEPRKQHELIKAGPAWLQLCSAMDVVADAEWALDSHARGEHAANSPGLLYLAHYGFLQAAYLQQDAAVAIQRCLGVVDGDRSRDSGLKRIRDLRNQAVGHPAGGKFGAVHFIVRATMRSDGFDLMSRADDGGVKQHDVDCRELREVQNRGIADVLREVVRALEEEVQLHKARFRAEPLAPEVEKLRYLVGKIFETAHAMQRGSIPAGQDLGPMAVRRVEATVSDLRTRLAERGYEPGVLPGADMAFGAVAHAMHRLRELLASDAGEIQGRDAEAFATHLDVHLNELIEIAREVDEDYGSAPARPAAPRRTVKIVIQRRKPAGRSKKRSR